MKLYPRCKKVTRTTHGQSTSLTFVREGNIVREINNATSTSMTYEFPSVGKAKEFMKNA